MSKVLTEVPSFREIMADIGTLAEISKEMGEKYPTVQAWHNRNSVPGEYHRRLVALARARGRRHITLDLLAQAAEIRGRISTPRRLKEAEARP